MLPFLISVENKMGLPPPYEQTLPNPAPPPSYFGNNPPPPPGLVVPPATAPRTTVITSPPGPGLAPGKLGPGPTGTTCATCNKSIVTRVDYVPNNRTHIVSAALCVLAGWVYQFSFVNCSLWLCNWNAFVLLLIHFVRRSKTTNYSLNRNFPLKIKSHRWSKRLQNYSLSIVTQKQKMKNYIAKIWTLLSSLLK